MSVLLHIRSACVCARRLVWDARLTVVVRQSTGSEHVLQVIEEELPSVLFLDD